MNSDEQTGKIIESTCKDDVPSERSDDISAVEAGKDTSGAIEAACHSHINLYFSPNDGAEILFKQGIRAMRNVGISVIDESSPFGFGRVSDHLVSLWAQKTSGNGLYTHQCVIHVAGQSSAVCAEYRDKVRDELHRLIGA